MLELEKIAAFLVEKRREKGFTQQQLAQRLHVSFQAVSKWETGASLPGPELLLALGAQLGVTVDEILRGQTADGGLTYRQAGIDISYTDAIKQDMAALLHSDDPRVLNGLGPFAALYDIRFDAIPDPVLVLKAEEPGSKQKLATQYGYTESICHDMINHLVNDIAVMGARPLCVLDTIICGNAEKDTIRTIVKGVGDACRANGCALVGGETSIQPQVVEKGVYILTSSVAGIVGRSRIVDGSRMEEGDVILALASNGLHTNGYTLVRLLMENEPQLLTKQVEGVPFLEAVMRPHTAYYPALQRIFSHPGVTAMAHITGGGMADNLRRVVPQGLSAVIDLAQVRTLPLFRLLRQAGSIRDEEMLRTFNCGVGLLLTVRPQAAEAIRQILSAFHPCYPVGVVGRGGSPVVLSGQLHW